MSTPSPSPPPFTPLPAQAPPSRSPGKGCLIGGCAGCAVAAVVLVAVGAAALWFAIGAWEESIATQIRDNPVVVEHLGRVEEVEVDWAESGAIPEADIMAFRVTGTLGTGLARLDLGDSDVATVRAGTLQLDDGTVVDLFAAEPEAGDETGGEPSDAPTAAETGP